MSEEGKPTRTEKSFERTLGALDAIFPFISDFVRINRLDESVGFALKLSIEEVFVNMVKYNTGGSNQILIGLEALPNKLVASVTDFDVEPFDVSKVENYDVSLPLDKRRPGGLGLHLIRSVMDEVIYHYEGRQSTVTLAKHLGRAHVSHTDRRE